MIAVHKSGGTNAGRRRIKPARGIVWFHHCDSAARSASFRSLKWQGRRVLEGCYTRCPDCGTRRP